MNCFNHQDIPAVCSCGSCAKGLCRNCMQACCGKFVCSNDCAENWEKLDKMNKRALKIYGLDESGKKPKATIARPGFLHLALGLLFFGYGLYDFFLGLGSYGVSSYSCFSAIFGLIFLIYGYKTYKDGIKL